MKDYALHYLNNIKEGHSKMENLVYIKLKLQNYLKDNNISVHAAKNLFRWRTRAAMFKMNYRNSYLNTACPYCLVQPDSQAHSLQCTVVKQKLDIQGVYSDIFDEDIPRDISDTLLKISKLREEIFK